MNSKLKKLLVVFALSILSGLASSVEQDPRHASVRCNSALEAEQIICDYRVSHSIKVEKIGAKIAGTPIQLDAQSFVAYPSGDQTTAVLFLVDTSDPARSLTIERRIVSDLFDILSGTSGKSPHLKYSLATFDTEFKVQSPFGASHAETLNALSKIKADGLATEFYKSILDGINSFKNAEASRKLIVIFSDGKDEDRAYRHEDVIKAAKELNVVIVGLGYAEKKSDYPSLQTLKRLSDETFGLYVNATNKSSLKEYFSDPFGVVEKGGRVLIPSKGFYGDEVISLEIGLSGSEKIVIDTKVGISDKRSYFDRFLIFLKKYWVQISLAILSILIVCFVAFKVFQKYRMVKPALVEYGYLHAEDTMGSKYLINKTAIRIGRSKDNDICLLNDSVSSHHAELHIKRGVSFFIVDLGSTNGVMVNGEKISQHELFDGDLIELGEVRLKFNSI
jgi:FHA domain/von Willebrand factor type A domain